VKDPLQELVRRGLVACPVVALKIEAGAEVFASAWAA